MPRLGRPPRERRGTPCEASIWQWLMDGERHTGDVDADFEIFMLRGDERALGRLWTDLGAAVLEAYIQTNPGKRPYMWWNFAPEPRQRVGGRGTPKAEVLAYQPSFVHGIPKGWANDEDWAFTTSGTPPTAYVPFDKKSPPTFEAQATYLKRLGLFLPGEERRLKVADFEPEAVELEDDDGD